jgi:F0F1-type ATP synthase assembly protein I
MPRKMNKRKKIQLARRKAEREEKNKNNPRRQTRHVGQIAHHGLSQAILAAALIGKGFR